MTEEYNSYEILDVRHDASDEEIKAAYLRLVKKSHPDAGGTNLLFRLVENAKEELLDHDRRAELDRRLANPDEDVWLYFEEYDEDDEDYPSSSQEATGVARWIEPIIMWIVWFVAGWLHSNPANVPESFAQIKNSPLPRRLRVIIWIIVVWLFLAAEYTSIANLLSGGLDFTPIIFWNLIFAALFMLYRHHHKAEKGGGIR